MRARETVTKFCVMIKLYDRKIFTGSTTPLHWPKIVVTGQLARDLFAVANLLVFTSYKFMSKIDKTRMTFCLPDKFVVRYHFVANSVRKDITDFTWCDHQITTSQLRLWDA